MTISLFWNKCLSTTNTPLLYVELWGVLRLDSISTVTKLVTVYRKKAKYRKIVRHNLRDIIETRHLLYEVLRTPQIEGYCDHLPPLFERYWTVLILRTIELLPIWIIFIDRIIDRIWISVVTLSSEFSNRNHFDNSSSALNSRGVELLNSERFVRCCIDVALNGPFLTAQNSVTKQYPQCRRPHIIR